MNEKSEKLWEKGSKLVLNGTSLFSRGPRISVGGVAPKYSHRANGQFFWSVDGARYLDYGMAVGSVLLGHKAIDVSVYISANKTGPNSTILSPLQVGLAEKLHKNIPSCDKMKFLSSGSEATESAVRMARIYTGRDKIIRDHYHGWMSWCVPGGQGVPECYKKLSVQKEDEDLDWFEKQLSKEDVACVILEPVKCNTESLAKRRTYLKKLKKLCEQTGTTLVYDEVACGYRFGTGGVQKVLGVIPDISAFGKSISNGYALSVVCCKDYVAEKIEDKLFVSSTFGGNPLSLSAGLVTLEHMEMDDVSSKLKRHGQQLKKLNNLIDFEGVRIEGTPNRIGWKQDDWDVYSLLIQEFLKKGIFFAWEIKNSNAHSDYDIESTMRIAEEVFATCSNAVRHKKVKELLEGQPIRPIL